MRLGSLPPLMLMLYAAAFGWKAFAGGLLIFDDHPGQLYRLAHAIEIGFAPWRWNPGWWAGYAELQFYPPGFSYAGAALHYASLGVLDASGCYRVMLWVTLLLPGVTTYALLRRLLNDPWLALPGAFVAFTLSADSRSGIEQGVRWGLVAARLAWGLLPLLALSLDRSRARRPLPLLAPIVLAAIILVHPAHAPAGIVLVLLAAWHTLSPAVSGARRATLMIGAGAGLSAFWLVPLVAHLEMAVPLAWGDPTLPTLARAVGNHPLLMILLAGAALTWWTETEHRWIVHWPVAMAAVIVLDCAIVQPLGIMWLPADRLVDSFLLSVLVSAPLALLTLRRRLPVPSVVVAAITIGFCLLLNAVSPARSTLALWPRSFPNEWPKQDVVARGVALPELWRALKEAPAGRILFVRSAVPLEPRPDWRRPHTHVTALAPLATGRQILNGTFTHPSPIAGLLYTGSAANRPVTSLVEQRDGVTLFGRLLSEIDAGAFNALADPLRVSAVIALDEDRERLDFVARNPAFTGPVAVGPFLVFTSLEPRPLPVPDGVQRRRVALTARGDGWASTGMAYSPLWRGQAHGQPLPVRRSDLGLLEVRTRQGETVDVTLEHRAGAAEGFGLVLSAGSAVALAVAAYRRRSLGPERSRT